MLARVMVPDGVAYRSPVVNCAGCNASLPLMLGRGNPRKWCSEKCRVRTFMHGTGILPVIACGYCKVDFPQSRIGRLYCSEQCVRSQASRTRRERRDAAIPLPRPCGRCGKEFTPSPNNIGAGFCSKACSQPEHKRRRRARLAAATVEPVNEFVVYERDGWICQICMQPIDRTQHYPEPLSPSLDHRVPLALGGEHSYRNCQASHYLCNASKGHRTEDPLAHV